MCASGTKASRLDEALSPLSKMNDQDMDTLEK